MQVREIIHEGLHIVQVAGEVDMARSPELRAVLATHAEAKRPALLVDFTEVKYIDSSGLATLVEYVQRSAAFGGKFAVGGLRENVQTIFEMVRLHEVFPVHSTVADARAALIAPAV
jgi:anti-sigma B factor antagonist